MAHFSCTICGQEGEFGAEKSDVTCVSWKTTAASCPNCIQVKAMDEHIEETRAYLRHLEAHRAALRRGANAFHDPFTSLLPTEIASKILCFCMDGEDRVERWIPLALSAVSKKWRVIAHSTPLLWASIRLRPDLRSGRYSYEDMLHHWLQRSSQCPLSIDLIVSSTQYTKEELENQYRPIIEILNAHCHRWGKLSVVMPIHLLSPLKGNFIGKPLLSHLEIRGTDPDDEDDEDSRIWKFDLGTSLPAPHTVSLSYCRPHNIHINWCNVTNLFIRFPTLHEIFALLKAAPLLRECRAEYLQYDIQAASGYQDLPIIHQNLTKFAVKIWEHTISPLFDALCFPDLNSLVYSGAYPTMSPLLSFLVRSSCPIKSLTIHLSSDSDHRAELCDILWAIPTVERLKIEGTCMFDNFFKLLADNEERRFLPSLVEFSNSHLADWISMFTWKEISKAVEARASLHHAESGLPVLKRFSLVVAEEKTKHIYCIDKESLQVFEKLLASGIDIKISYWKKDFVSTDDFMLYSRAYHEEQKRQSTSDN
ncbi:unnamed protein product [Cyclocybe aegerita]|uniref:F-box domain-containing protein n=1 Tax=Cyclocybe aegerita TaxID=1973307 RepID=A0A8S0W5I6_CYCAE|nr:unnamed protein product [Cyclocybe aegerita]